MRQLFSKISNHPYVAERPIVKQALKFGLVGAMNTAIDYMIFSSLVYLVHVHYLMANALSFSIAVTNSYVLNRRWTFRSDNPQWRSEAAKFLVVNLIALGLSELLLTVFVDRLSLPKLIAKALAIGIVLFWNFFGTRLWAFRRPPAGLPG